MMSTTVQKILEQLSPQAQKMLKKSAQPEWIEPMLATLTSNYFSSPTWIYEHKWDGERLLAYKKNKKVTLYSRNHKIINHEYPEVVSALEAQQADSFIIDGEVIAYSKKNTSFELLEGRMHEQEVHPEEQIIIEYCIFDIMYFEGYMLVDLPLKDRKIVLNHSLNFTDPLQLTPVVAQNGLAYFKQACKKGWEGVMAKDLTSPYESVRSKSWLKFKCINQQEFVIAGYTDPQRSRINFGALLVGYYKQGELIYAGKVGTGFTQGVLRDLGIQLHKLTQKKCPFDHYDGPTKAVHWVKPLLVAEIKFAQWTEYNKLRIPVYKGLRVDKDARDVVQEKPKAVVPHEKSRS